MKQRNLTIVAVACGLACAACIVFFMMSVQGEAAAARAEALERYGGEQVEVCVATRDVAAGERLDASAVETRLWIADLLPEGAVREAAQVVGRTATSSLIKGEVVCEKRFESSRSDLDIPAGKVAVSVPAKAVQAVGGAVSAGMSVDVYSSGDTTTKALARDVVVLATSVGESGSLVAGEAGFVTLAVEPKRVQEIIEASNRTSLYFVLPGAEAPAAEKGGASASAGRDAVQEGTDAGTGKEADGPKSANASAGASQDAAADGTADAGGAAGAAADGTAGAGDDADGGAGSGMGAGANGTQREDEEE